MKMELELTSIEEYYEGEIKLFHNQIESALKDKGNRNLDIIIVLSEYPCLYVFNKLYEVYKKEGWEIIQQGDSDICEIYLRPLSDWER